MNASVAICARGWDDQITQDFVSRFEFDIEYNAIEFPDVDSVDEGMFSRNPYVFNMQGFALAVEILGINMRSTIDRQGKEIDGEESFNERFGEMGSEYVSQLAATYIAQCRAIEAYESRLGG